MRILTRRLVLFTLAIAAISLIAAPLSAADRPNILLFTADDLNCDSVGVFGCKVKGTTPHIDKLASQGMRFERAHVNIAVCQPVRNVINTGRYSHRNGGEGFFNLRKKGLPVLPGVLREGGYAVGILSKVPHSTPYGDFAWDFSHSRNDTKRNPHAYARFARQFFDKAKADGKPFYLMANSNDPHRPFNPAARRAQNRPKHEQNVPASRLFKPGEITVPGFLPDLPDIRTEIADYYGCVRRCDDIVGAVLKELDDAGLADNTIVIFLSDHGIAVPFAKTNCWYHSTRTPLIVRWPGRVKPGAVDREHMVSTIDLMPTLLDVAGLKHPTGMDGRSITPLLEGKSQDGRDRVFTQFFMTSGRREYPMRAVNDKRFNYIFNAWGDGKTAFRNESQAGLTFKAMQAAGKDDPAIAARVELFVHRVPEELYDYENDPDALNNLLDTPHFRETRDRLRKELLAWMKETKDPLAEAFEAYLKEAK